jgi:hypothetical protein
MDTIKPTHHSEYNVDKHKIAILNSLKTQVINAKNEVVKMESIVNSLTQKAANYENFLNQAENTKKQALHNLTLVNNGIENTQNLNENSNRAFSKTILASSKSEEFVQKTNTVLNKLIYTAERINKFSNLIARQKALNPLISDELISSVTTAGTDANNAVALALLALNTAFTAQSTTKEISVIAALESIQSEKLLEQLIHANNIDCKNSSLKILLNKAYNQSVIEADEMQKANEETLNQLNQKKAELNKAQVNLNSLQSGLAAANAANLAS